MNRIGQPPPHMYPQMPTGPAPAGYPQGVPAGYPQGVPTYPAYFPPAQPMPVYVPVPVQQPSTGAIVAGLIAGVGANALLNTIAYSTMPWGYGTPLYSPFPTLDNWDGGFNMPGPF